MKMSTLKLLVPIVAITVQSNSASTIIPPFLHDLRIPMAAIGSLISLGPILALTSRLPVGMAYQRNRARLLISIAVLAMGITNYFYSFAQDILVVCHCSRSQWFCLRRRDDALHGVLRRLAGPG